MQPQTVVRRGAWILGLLAILPATATAQTAGSPLTPEVVTTGTGFAVLPPDRATVRIGVATRAATASAASGPNGPLVARVQDTLRAIGLPPQLVRAVSFGVAPNFDYQNARRLIDYEARTTLDVRLDNLANLGRLMDAVLAAGATDISNIIFESDSLAVARQRALGDALRSARDDAAALAKAAGGRLGELRLVTTSPESRSEQYVTAYQAARIEPGIPAVRRDVVVSVVVWTRWALLVP